MLCALAAHNAAANDTLTRAEQAYSAGDYSGAVALWQPLAENGDAQAQFALGNAYERGHGVVPDIQEAARWYRSAAQSGLPQAQYNLGNLYLNGQGVEEDAVTAVGLFRLAAEQGFFPAQFNLAYAYDQGVGVRQDRAQAATWYARAAIGGSGDAMQRLSELRREGVVPAALPALQPSQTAALPRRSDASGTGSAATAGFAATTANNGNTGESPTPGWYLRLAAYRSEERAKHGWDLLRSRHGAVLGDLDHALHTIDLGAQRGRFLRLLAGPLPNEETARQACAAISAGGGDCLVQRIPERAR